MLAYEARVEAKIATVPEADSKQTAIPAIHIGLGIGRLNRVLIPISSHRLCSEYGNRA